jgi:cysteine synthase A
MSAATRDVLLRIGGTSLIGLRRLGPAGSARILLKMESENPTGSMKDRMALAMIEAGEADGRLRPGGSVVEYTGGSTGVSLSLVCAVKGYPLHIVTSDAFAREKLDHMRLLGARLQVVRSEGGGMTEKLTRDMVETARDLAARTGAFWTNQLQNPDQLGAHRIDGVGVGFVPPLWRADVADRIEHVSTEEATAMTLRLAREEGLFGGTSTGANVVAALRLAERLGPDATIVTILADTGMKYLSRLSAEFP